MEGHMAKNILAAQISPNMWRKDIKLGGNGGRGVGRRGVNMINGLIKVFLKCTFKEGTKRFESP